MGENHFFTLKVTCMPHLNPTLHTLAGLGNFAVNALRGLN